MVEQSAAESFAYILGVYLGDGCVTTWRAASRSDRLVFRLNTIDEDFAGATKMALADISGYTATICCHPVSKSSKPNWALALGDRALCQRLITDTHKKQVIPSYAFDWSRELKLAFIVGLMDSEGYVAGNSNHTGRRFYMGFKSCDAWVPDFIRILHSVGIATGKVGIERPRRKGYKTPIRFAIKMQSWIDSGARVSASLASSSEWVNGQLRHQIREDCAFARSNSDQVGTVLYQTLRSVSDHHIFVVCRDGTFYDAVPADVRKRGPWQGQHRGEVECLKPEYRLALARDGYMLVRCEAAVFKPEA